MKIKAKITYNDLELGRMVAKDEIIDVSEERAAELTSVNNKAGVILAEKIETVEEAAAKTPKKKRTAKNDETGTAD